MISGHDFKDAESISGTEVGLSKLLLRDMFPSSPLETIGTAFCALNHKQQRFLRVFNQEPDTWTKSRGKKTPETIEEEEEDEEEGRAWTGWRFMGLGWPQIDDIVSTAPESIGSNITVHPGPYIDQSIEG